MGATAPQAIDGAPPVLWHLKMSNYNEKARWALDYKRIPHVRRAVHPPRHRAIARRLTGGNTFPVLIVAGAATGESARIIDLLEQRWPEPPLYPLATAEREHALELERFFDVELGPHARLLVLHYLVADRDLLLDAFAPDLRGVRRSVARALYPALRSRLIAGFGIDDHSVDRAYAQLEKVADRVRSEKRASGYLASDEFSVADLTLAALLGPPVAPPQYPYPQPHRDHPLLAPLRRRLDELGLLAWTAGMYARHRGESAEMGAE